MSTNLTKPRKAGKKAAPRPRSAPGAETPQEFRRRVAAEEPEPEQRRYLLRLYVTGLTSASGRAIERVRKVCEEHLKGRYELEVVDIYQKPSLAKDEQIVATPTLIKVLPSPLRRFIGDLSKAEKVLFGLDLKVKE